MTNARWNSGTRVKLTSSDFEMTVVGYDSVGSAICEWIRGEHLVRGYIVPTILALADNACLARGIS
jgi:uncharacterized protein YodC (DUF2158 family)